MASVFSKPHLDENQSPLVDASFSFLTESPEIQKIDLLGSCNGLVLFGYGGVAKHTYDSELKRQSIARTIVLKALRRGTASDPVGMARRRLGGRLGEQGDALPICHREEMKRNRK